MDKEYLREVVKDQKLKISNLPLGYPRNKLSKLDSLLNHKINIVITGPRRAGKSTFLLQWMHKVYKDDFYYFDFSDDRVAGLRTEDLQTLYELFLELYGEKKAFFFDEIQGKYDWNKFVNRLYSEGYRFFITGSNAELLSKEISTYLTGRHYDITILPFSFKEFLGFNKINLDTVGTKNKTKIKSQLEVYLNNGGFPEVVTFGNKDILDNVYKDVINKDVILRYGIKEEEIFKKLSVFLISNFAKDFSYNSLAKTFGLGSVNTVSSYVSYLADAYIIFELPKYDYSFKKQDNSAKKIYCVDNGLINKIAFAFSENKGRLYENTVFVDLLSRGYGNNENLYYYKTKSNKEVDFVLFEGLKPKSLIQVCYDLTKAETKERELNALLEASEELKCNNLFIITGDYEETEEVGKKEIKYVPLWKWLLE